MLLRESVCIRAAAISHLEIMMTHRDERADKFIFRATITHSLNEEN